MSDNQVAALAQTGGPAPPVTAGPAVDTGDNGQVDNLLPGERPVQTSGGTTTINGLFGHLDGMTPDDTRAELKFIFDSAQMNRMAQDTVAVLCYDLAHELDAAREGITDAQFQQFVQDSFPDIEQTRARHQNDRNRINESLNRIRAVWREGPAHRAIAGGLGALTKDRLAAIGRVAHKDYGGNLGRLTLDEAVRAASRRMLIRYAESKRYGTMLTTRDWRKVFDDDSPDITPFTPAELAEMYNLRREQLVVANDGTIMSQGQANALGLGGGPQFAALPPAQSTSFDNAPSAVQILILRAIQNADELAETEAEAATAALDAQEAGWLAYRQETEGVGSHGEPADSGEPAGSGAPADGDAPADGGEEPATLDDAEPTVDIGASSVTKKCGCSAVIKRALVTRIENTSKQNAGLVQVLLRFVVDNVFEAGHEVCMKHLRDICRVAKLHIRKTTKVQAQARIRDVCTAYEDGTIRALKTRAPSCYWFNLGDRAPRAADLRDQYKYEHSRPWSPDALPAGFDYAAHLDLFFPGASAEYDKVGSVNIPVFQWWVSEGLVDIFREEAQMYQHHLRYRPNTEPAGWIRNMYHSLGQQAMRMDPLYWMAYVCLRPDHGWRLVSYPYYAKFALPGTQTGFKHIDISPFRAVHEGYGVDMVQGTVSLTDEDENNCTIILPGMHKWLHGWVHAWSARGFPGGKGDVVALGPNVYTAEDEDKFARWTPAPCRAGEARITHATVGHGSTPQATKLRMTMLPWFELVNEDHLTLELPEGGTYRDIANGHRDLMPGPLTPSGHPVMYGKINYPFPGAIHLESPTAIGAALLARAPWTANGVAWEMKMLFGGDRAAVDRYIADYRVKLKASILAGWEKVKMLEREAFGDKSYFYNLEHHGPNFEAPPADDPDPDLSDIIAVESGESEDGNVDNAQATQAAPAAADSDQEMAEAGSADNDSADDDEMPDVDSGGASDDGDEDSSGD